MKTGGRYSGRRTIAGADTVAARIAKDPAHPVEGFILAPGRPGLWLHVSSGTVVDPRANRIVGGPADGKKMWPDLPQYQFSQAELAAFASRDKGLIDYVTDPQGLRRDAAEAASAGAGATVQRALVNVAQNVARDPLAYVALGGSIVVAAVAPVLAGPLALIPAASYVLFRAPKLFGGK